MDLLATSASGWQKRLQDAELSSVKLIEKCLEQIDSHNHQGQCLNALINVVPRDVVLERARQMDTERARGQLRGPMHGIPIILKDIIATDKSQGLPTTCGAHALRSAFGKKNCLLAQRLLDAGLIIIGKSNLNEYCRVQDVKSGWSVLGGQTQSPYIEDGLASNEAGVGNSTISGSSSGSSAGVAAGFAPLAIGTETVGSVVIPANRGGIFSLKLTNALAPKEGILCLSTEIDSVGVMAKSAIDISHMFSIMTDTRSTMPCIDPEVKLRVGFVNPRTWRFPDEACPQTKKSRDFLVTEYERAIKVLQAHGVDTVSDLDLSDEPIKYEDENIVGLIVDSEFRDNFAAFAAGLEGTDVRTLAELIEYNEKHAEVALPKPFEAQDNLKRVNDLHSPPGRAEAAFQYGKEIAGEGRLDRVMTDYGLDLIVTPGDSMIFVFAGMAGYPIASIPLSSLQYDEKHSRPEGLLVVGRPHSEQTILDFMLRCEQVFPARPLPAPLLPETTL